MQRWLEGGELEIELCGDEMEREMQLRQRLANATQRIQWNYSIFWSFCPQRQVLVWREGYVNVAESTELSLRRSQHLQELFTAMNRTDATSQPSASQASEVLQQFVQGLTSTEWFCMSSMACRFASGAGLPGRAYEGKSYVWHCITNEGDTRAFVRARLAQRARIQTIVCIPALDGVVEFGTTTLVKETTSLLRQMQSAFSAHMTRAKLPAMSAFERWSTRGVAPSRERRPTNDLHSHRQRMLKTALFTIPRLYTVKAPESQVHVQEELGEEEPAASDRQWRSHAVAERKRREKLKNKFVTLRSLVPSVKKACQVSLLGGAIEYVRVLQKRLEELESHRSRRPQEVVVTMENNNIAAVKITCAWKNGLFIDVLRKMVTLHLEVVDATVKVSDGLLTATLKAKVTSTDKLDNDEQRDEIQATLLSTIEEKLSNTAQES